MKGLKLLLTLVAAACLLVGCATPYPVGYLYTQNTLPVTATDNAKGGKVGEATCNSYLALIAVGDCSIETAKKNGNITAVTAVDWDAQNILGLIGTYKLKVYGN